MAEVIEHVLFSVYLPNSDQGGERVRFILSKWCDAVPREQTVAVGTGMKELCLIFIL